MFEVVGIEKINRVAKSTGLPYSGTVLHCTQDDEKVGGMRVNAIYCNASVDCSSVCIGSVIDVFFNQYGKPAYINIIK